MEKLFIDRRVACIALRFKDIVKKEGNGLHFNMASVIYYASLTRDENLNLSSERVNEMHIDKINQLNLLLEKTLK